MKKKIGFIDYDVDDPKEESVQEPDRSKVSEIILNSYLPALSASEADELLSQTDVLEFVGQFIKTPHGAAVHDMLTELGFKTKTIDGKIYWMVKNA